MDAHLKQSRRLVIKVGSSLVLEEGTGAPRREWLASLAGDIANLKTQGKEVLLVSSGAVGLGRGVMGLKGKALRLEEKQAAAACGQSLLIDAWRDAFEPHGLNVAQVLLSIEDSEVRRRYLNARSTFMTLLMHGVVPIINENDTVATTELKIGDNDRLAARVAQMAGADVLVLLSDVDGLYTNDPRRDKNATLIPEVKAITPEIEKMAGSAGVLGSGGMVTKIAAAKIAVGSGCNMLLARGTELSPIARAMESGGEGSGTWFIASSSPKAARKHWIAGAVEPRGWVSVDEGAVSALGSGKSLLPAGVKDVGGAFEKGDTVLIKAPDGRILGKGLIAYDADDARKIMGKKTTDIESALGFKGRDELIHRDDMVLT